MWYRGVNPPTNFIIMFKYLPFQVVGHAHKSVPFPFPMMYT